MNKKRAQAWGYDLIAGLTIFVIGIFAFFLFSLNYSSGGDTKLDELEYQGKVVGDSLLSEGYPNSWTVQNFTDGKLESIGLMSNGIINKSKLNQFYLVGDFGVSVSDYQKTKGILNLKDEYWINFTERIGVKDAGNNNIVISGIGKPITDEKNIIRVSRVVSNGTDVQTVNIFIWN